MRGRRARSPVALGLLLGFSSLARVAEARCQGAATAIPCCDKLPTESFDDNPYYHRQQGIQFGDQMEVEVPRSANPSQLCAQASTVDGKPLATAVAHDAAGIDLSTLTSSSAAAVHRAFFSIDLGQNKREIDRVWREDQRMIRESGRLADGMLHGGGNAAQLRFPPGGRAAGMFANLSEHGFTHIPRFPSLDVDALRREVATAMARRGANDNTEVLYFGERLRALEPLLADEELRSVVSAYFGHEPAELTGYAMLHLGRWVNKDLHYPSGQWHHDRCGRRLKLFVYLDSVDRRSHPTWVVRGTHKRSWFGIGSDDLTRFDEAWVHANFGARLEPMLGPKAGGFLFDTNTLHKGDVDGTHKARNVVVVEVGGWVLGRLHPPPTLWFSVLKISCRPFDLSPP